LFESDSTIPEMANECLVFWNTLWNASCTDGFGVLSGRGDERIGELDGAGGVECITPSPASNVNQDTFYSDWHWGLGDWRRKVGHEGNE
jgi:hypothetical protein